MKRIEVVYNPKKVFEHVAQRVMNDLEIPFTAIHEDCIVVPVELNLKQRKNITKVLQEYSVRIIEKGEGDLIAQIKDCIRMVVANNKLRKRKISTVLSEKMGYSYSYLSTLFSTETFTSIENFCIFVKIEKAKELLMNRNTTLAEVAYQLDYSSTSHLSRQFKRTTGLTVSEYLKLLAIRANNKNELKT